ncbi:hypothetical protein SprV_0702356700 [Sparganum proliferum]
MERGREVEVGVGLHLRQKGDGGVGDGGGAVEDASEVLGPSLKNVRLLGEKGIAVGAEERSCPFGRRTVDNFDRDEEVLPFVSVRVPVDFLGLASRSSVLHLAQPL